MIEYTKSLAFWNDIFGTLNAEAIEEKLSIELGFDNVINEFASRCKNILDYGCGYGLLSFQVAQHPDVESVLGTDTSEKGIHIAAETAHLSGLDKLIFKVGGVEILKNYPDGSFDGAIISNVLDVIPEDVAREIAIELHRVVKKGGIILVKINSYIKPGEETKFGLTQISGNLYGKNGILRVNNCTNEQWRNWWANWFTEESYGEYPCQREDVFDRLFLLKNWLD